MSAPAQILPDVMTDQGTIATDRLARVRHITKAVLATATGLSRDAVSKRDRLNSRQTQTRLRDAVEIIHPGGALDWAGGPCLRLVGSPAWHAVQGTTHDAGRLSGELRADCREGE
jgi:hypothetical protein